MLFFFFLLSEIFPPRCSGPLWGGKDPLPPTARHAPFKMETPEFPHQTGHSGARTGSALRSAPPNTHITNFKGRRGRKTPLEVQPLCDAEKHPPPGELLGWPHRFAAVRTESHCRGRGMKHVSSQHHLPPSTAPAPKAPLGRNRSRSSLH